jgi:hypothetical protein
MNTEHIKNEVFDFFSKKTSDKKSYFNQMFQKTKFKYLPSSKTYAYHYVVRRDGINTLEDVLVLGTLLGDKGLLPQQLHSLTREELWRYTEHFCIGPKGYRFDGNKKQNLCFLHWQDKEFKMENISLRNLVCFSQQDVLRERDKNIITTNVNITATNGFQFTNILSEEEEPEVEVTYHYQNCLLSACISHCTYIKLHDEGLNDLDISFFWDLLLEHEYVEIDGLCFSFLYGFDFNIYLMDGSTPLLYIYSREIEEGIQLDFLKHFSTFEDLFQFKNEDFRKAYGIDKYETALASA